MARAEAGTAPAPAAASSSPAPEAPVPTKTNGVGSKATPAQHRAIKSLAENHGWIYPQGLEGELAQHEGYPAKVDDLTVTRASKVIEWLSGKGSL